jgi:hypothetical protein
VCPAHSETTLQLLRRQIASNKRPRNLMSAAKALQQFGHLAVRHPADKGPQGSRPAATLDARHDLPGLVQARPCGYEQPLRKRRHDAGLLQRRVPEVVDPVLVAGPHP